jgi:hypothetical protein
MKTKDQPIKMRNIYTMTDVYYTYPNWNTKEIDGVLFLPVLKDLNSKNIFYIRKDSLEKTK